jgi:beta-lactamase class D
MLLFPCYTSDRSLAEYRNEEKSSMQITLPRPLFKIAFAFSFMTLLSGMAQTAFAGQPDFAAIFKGTDACFLLVDMRTGKPAVEYNEKRCARRFSPCSSFKIPLALMAFDAGLLKDENTVLKWDGVKREYDEWNRDQTPKTWLRNSPLWVSQQLTPELGMAKVKKYLKEFNYGNQDMSGGLKTAWLAYTGRTLKISADEQIAFLDRFWRGQLALSPKAVELTKKSIYAIESSSGTVIHGKTGSGDLEAPEIHNGKQLGWFVGHLQQGNREYLFAVNFSDLKRPANTGPGGMRAREMTKLVLSELKLF